jgi:5-formyltetrahydrofolate cyclo-ligase
VPAAFNLLSNAFPHPASQGPELALKPSGPKDGSEINRTGPETKVELRRHFRQLSRQAVAAVEGALVAAAAADLPGLMEPPRWLGLYSPLGHEPDLRPLVERLPAHWRHHIALPAIRADQLMYLPWQPGDPLAPDAVGIPAPLGEVGLEPGQLGLLLVPALAVDRCGWRLGSGGGWYDRLRSQPGWRAVPAVVVLPSICVVPALPRDPWDVPFMGWLDERGFHRANKRVATS